MLRTKQFLVFVVVLLSFNIILLSIYRLKDPYQNTFGLEKQQAVREAKNQKIQVSSYSSDSWQDIPIILGTDVRKTHNQLNPIPDQSISKQELENLPVTVTPAATNTPNPSTPSPSPIKEPITVQKINIEGIDVVSGLSATFHSTMQRFIATESPKRDPIYFEWEGINEIQLGQLIQAIATPYNQEMIPSDITPEFSSKTLLTSEEYHMLYPQMPKGPSFSCLRIETICHILRPTLLDAGFYDSSKLYGSLMRAQSFSKMPPPLIIWCILVAQTSELKYCFLSALGMKDSPLGDLRFVEFQSARIFMSHNSITKVEWAVATRNILFLDELMPLEWFGDKATLYIAAQQQSSANVQRKVQKYIPRTYYISTPCTDNEIPKNELFDQWNLWVDDYFEGDVPGEFIRDVDEESSHYPGDPMIWREKQKSLDLGANLWVSKPTVFNLYTNGELVNAMLTHEPTIHTHEGNGIQVVNHPSDLYRAIQEDTIKFRKCIGNHRILQKYVEQPLLMDGRKADIRIYVFITSLLPIEAYFHTKVIPVRHARSNYNESNTDDRAHVTNLSKALREEQEDIHRYWFEYRAALAELRGVTEKEIEEELFPKLRLLVRSVLEMLPEGSHLDNAAAFMGWDIILDSDMNPWVMETNLRPDMRISISQISLLNPQIVNTLFEIMAMRFMNEEIPEQFYSWMKV